MGLQFRILNGNKAGLQFKILPGISIGREHADIILPDKRVSDRHAVVQRESNDQLILVDNGSRNGLIVDGQKFTEVCLTPGVKIQIGKTQLSVVEVVDDSKKIENLESQSWREDLINCLKKIVDNTPSDKKLIQPFVPPIILKFLTGPQYQTTWHLGYGPRKVGRNSVDLPLFDETALPHCFEISPSENGPQLSTSHPEKVHINGLSLNKKILMNADTITVGNTKIQVEIPTSHE